MKNKENNRKKLHDMVRNLSPEDIAKNSNSPIVKYRKTYHERLALEKQNNTTQPAIGPNQSVVQPNSDPNPNNMYYSSPNANYIHTPDYRHDFIFSNPNVHSIMYNGTQYWLAKDIARELKHPDSHDMVKRNVKPGNSIELSDKDFGPDNLSGSNFESLGFSKKVHHATFLTERGVYDCLDHSRKSSEAEEFRNWYNSEVRPSIRQTGHYDDANLRSYISNHPKEAMDYIIDIDNQLNDKNNKIETIEAERDSIASELVKSKKEVTKLNKTLEYNKALATVGETFLKTMPGCSIDKLANIMNSAGIDIGRNRLFELLRKDGYLNQDNSASQKSLDMGLMVSTVSNNDYATFVTTMITNKGIEHFINKYSYLIKK